MHPKCVLCLRETFKSVEALKNHFVVDHSIPSNDAILNRYVKLRFSPSQSADKLSSVIKLLKVLKQKATKYSLQREKKKLDSGKIRNLFIDYENFEEADSINSDSNIVENERLNRSAVVNWFMYYYDVFINNDTDNIKDQGTSTRLFSEEEKLKVKCARIKVQQKEGVALDFNDKMKVNIDASPFETFVNIIRVLFLAFFSKVKKSENSCQILIEITAEFTKSDDESNTYVYEDEFNTFDYVNESNERRTIREYSTTVSGNTKNIRLILNESMSHVITKVINSFNVIGSNWALRRILNLNISVMYDVLSFTSISRLVKGKVSTSTSTQQNTHSAKEEQEEERIERIVLKCLKRLRPDESLTDEKEGFAEPQKPKKTKVSGKQRKTKLTPRQFTAKLPVPRAPVRVRTKKIAKPTLAETKSYGKHMAKRTKSSTARGACSALEFSAEHIRSNFFNKNDQKNATRKTSVPKNKVEKMDVEVEERGSKTIQKPALYSQKNGKRVKRNLMKEHFSNNNKKENNGEMFDVDERNIETIDLCEMESEIESSDDEDEILKLNAEMIDDDQNAPQEGPAFYKIVNEQLPTSQTLRIVGQNVTPLNLESEISEYESEEDENVHLVEGDLNELGEQELNFRFSDNESEGKEQPAPPNSRVPENVKPNLELMKDEVIIHDEGSSEDDDDEGVTLIRNTKDGTTKIVFSGDQKDITKKMLESIKGKLAKSKKKEIIDFKLDDNEPLFAKVKSEENCFITSILGCVAMCVFQAYQRKRFEEGETVTKEELDKFGILDCPYNFIKNFGIQTIGVDTLPERMFEKDFLTPSINGDNIADKLTSVETELQNHGINISFNLYTLADDKVVTRVVSGDETTSVSRLTSSVIIAQCSRTGKPRSHNNSFNLIITEEGEGKQFHCSVLLNVGKFIYHNEERFFYKKGIESLAKTINETEGCLTGEKIGGEEKIMTGSSRRRKSIAMSWQNVYNCNACMTGFLKKKRFKDHIALCVGGHVSSMVFEKIPHVEHFEPRDYSNTLLCPIVASFDTEACANKDIARRLSKNGQIYKSDERKEAEMILCGVVATVIVRPNRKNDYTIYKDTSMTNEELLDYSTVPYPIRQKIEVEDLANLEISVDQFRTAMNAFIELKSKIVRMHLDLVENPIPNVRATKQEQINAANALLPKRRLEASRRFGVFFMQFFQTLMECTKKEVAFKSEKTLKLSWKERLNLLDGVLKNAESVFDDGVLYFINKKNECSDNHQLRCVKEAMRIRNSVKDFNEFNCVICNHKLDPIYLSHLRKYYQQKIENGKGDDIKDCDPSKDNEDDNNVDDNDDYQMLWGDEIIRLSSTSKSSNEGKPKSPHVNIWPGRNMWQVKDKLLTYFYSEINRLKQELLVVGYRKKKAYASDIGLSSIEEISSEKNSEIEYQASEDVISDYHIENANKFVMTLLLDEWKFTEPYDALQREQLIECFYRFVEGLATIEQFMKVFHPNSAASSLQHDTVSSFANQNAAKTYYQKNSLAEFEQERLGKEYKNRVNPLGMKKKNVFWFIGEQAYQELGEKVLRLVSLLKPEESSRADNYTPRTIYDRICSIKIEISEADLEKYVEDEAQEECDTFVNAQREEVLKRRLFHSFVKLYPQFEFELKLFFDDGAKRAEFRDKMINVYLDSIAVHHNHYFPGMQPVGHAHQSCNIITYTKGFPTPHIYVHNLTNYDSDFILKMLPPDILAHRGKNTEKQWSVISPEANNRKVKLLMTPFGTFSDSMNFFASGLSKMAEQMSERDVVHLYELHLHYFQRSQRFKQVLKDREREGKPFTLEFFKTVFKGKLIFPYEDMDDIDWLNKTSEKLPCIESFMKNRMGKTEVTEEQYLNMSQIYDYFGCKTMSDLLHIYTIEDGMLLAVIMSNTFQDMYESLGLDPTNFTSTAKFSYIACKRLLDLKMQTIPNGRVFNCIVEMKRAGFSLVKKQVSVASPLNNHIKDCQYSPSCKQCSPFVKVITN